ncbi:MAG TPA: hypothetical protein EYQ75_25925 [Planctomycetaceae bacterium]|nr:hypothetical protein [Planctomycetaceae bacterium]
MKRFSLLFATLVLALTTRAASQTSYPMLMSLQPAAAETGVSSEHTITSRYSMYGADQVIVTGEGVLGEIIHPEIKEGEKEKPPNLQSIKVRFTVAADAAPGVRDFRIATPRGASTLGQLVIVRDAVVREAKNNDTADTAQAVDVPATICGCIEKAEDVDTFKFTAKAGGKLSFHVRSMRLQNRIHDLQKHVDPILTLRNSAGVTLKTSDNFFYGDPFFAYEFTLDGEYFLEVRDVRYQGNSYWEYSIEVSDRPFLTNLYPLALSTNQTASVEMIGFNLPAEVLATVKTPDEIGPARISVAIGNVMTNPAPTIISNLILAIENDQENNTPELAMPVTMPVGINGRIESESDIDCYVFEAKKGERLSIEVLARRHGSVLDSHLRILDMSGKQMQLNDDLRVGKRNYADSLIENWTAPADGKYVIEIRDLHLRGGDSYVYFVEVKRAFPYFELFVDTDKTQLTPGTSGVLFVRVVRKNGFTGEVRLSIEGLPPNVTAECGRILPEKGSDGCIVVSASPEAATALANITISGSATIQDGGEERVFSTTATPYQETYQPGGGRGHFPAMMHTISVADHNDILSVELSEYDITLKPGESKKIDVTLSRASGFDKNVSLDVIYKHLSSVYGNSLPDGVTLDAGASKILLTKGASQGHIVLKAETTAKPVKKQQVSVMANVSLNFVMKATYCSRPLNITVEAAE